MTEPRKTPRTDVRTWKTATGETVVFASVAQDLEIETQELAEELEDVVNTWGGRVCVEPTKEAREWNEVMKRTDSALARHRAKQEVQS